MRKYLWLLTFLLFASPAAADWTGKDAANATITFKNANTCSSVVCVPIAQPVDSTGAAFGVTGNPFFMSFGTGVTLPAFTSPPAVAQSGTWTVQPGNTANTTAWKVDGSAVTQPVSGAAAAFANGASVAQGSTTDVPCTLPASATACSQLATEKAIANAVNGAIPAGTNRIGVVGLNDGTNTQVYDPCQSVIHSKALVNIVTAANTKIITNGGTKKTYVCGITLYPGGTDNFAIVEGSGTNCATSPLALIGGNTAATGIIATAQAGFVSNGGGYSVMATTVATNDTCIITSAAVQLSGVVDYVQQ